MGLPSRLVVRVVTALDQKLQTIYSEVTHCVPLKVNPFYLRRARPVQEAYSLTTYEKPGNTLTSSGTSRVRLWPQLPLRQLDRVLAAVAG